MIRRRRLSRPALTAMTTGRNEKGGLMSYRRYANGLSLSHGEEFQYRNRNVLRCAFCGLGEGEVARLFEGRNGNYICNECVDVSAQLLADYRLMGLPPPMLRVPWYRRILRGEGAAPGSCSFCEMPQREGERLLAGDAVQICERCIHACESIRAGGGYTV
ncbi:MAG: ClpX C4-type zinc finger protein [Blastocatellia bacterium]